MTGSRTGGEDRTTEVDNGRTVGKTTIDFGLTPTALTTGYYEYAVVKYERSFTVPAIGTDPVPTSANIITGGLQRECRSLAPGYVLQFGIIPATKETVVTRKIIINWAKFNKEKVRDGDYYCIIFFNRTDGAGVYDLHIRYKTYTVK